MQSAAAPATFTCCPIARQLAEQFAIAARLYAEAVASLTSHIAMSQTEYERLCRAAKDAHRRSEEMGRAFEEHVASHRCVGKNPQAESHGAA